MPKIEFLNQDALIGNEDDMPTILFSDRIKGILARTMDNTVIVKLLGRSIGYKALRSCIVSMWKPEGEIQIIDLDNGYYLVCFDHNDHIIPLTKGPCIS